MKRPAVRVEMGPVRLSGVSGGQAFEAAFREALGRLLDGHGLEGARGQLRLGALRVEVPPGVSSAEAAARAARAVYDASLAALGREMGPGR